MAKWERGRKSACQSAENTLQSAWWQTIFLLSSCIIDIPIPMVDSHQQHLSRSRAASKKSCVWAFAFLSPPVHCSKQNFYQLSVIQNCAFPLAWVISECTLYHLLSTLFSYQLSPLINSLILANEMIHPNSDSISYSLTLFQCDALSCSSSDSHHSFFLFSHWLARKWTTNKADKNVLHFSLLVFSFCLMSFLHYCCCW